MSMINPDLLQLRLQLTTELTGNILPFWMKYAPDEGHGGYFGSVDNELHINNEAPRTAILCARILWTFSAAYRNLGNKKYLQVAEQAYEYLTSFFWDQTFGGVYWSVDKQGHPRSDRKHHYAQAFAIYSFTEYFRATQAPESLKYAIDLFRYVEQHAYDPEFGGYIEGHSRDWKHLKDMRLSAKDMNCAKSMNTMLHLLEAFTNLNRIWKDVQLSHRLEELTIVFLDKIFDDETYHLKLFFDDRWNSMSEHISFGHDIEASWLICEAANLVGDRNLNKRAQAVAVLLAERVLENGVSSTGAYILNEPADNLNQYIEWWPQVEGMVGFYNAFQITHEEKYLDSVMRLWDYIMQHFIDHEKGGWFKKLDTTGKPISGEYKIGPWEGPYHHSRACLELAERIPVS